MELFEVKVRYQKIDSNGKEKMVNENYLVDAVSFSDAEYCINKEMQSVINCEFLIKAIKRSNVSEVHIEGEYIIYKVKTSFVSFNEESGREKKSSTYILVSAESIEAAKFKIDELFNDVATDYIVEGVADSKLVDYFSQWVGDLAE